MKAFLTLLGLAIFIQPALVSAGWNFSERVALGNAATPGVFHHLDGAGRKHVAVSGDWVAVIWEDDHSSSPQIYVAYKTLQQSRFAKALTVSDGEEAYEPSITGLANDQFALAWEQDGTVYLRLLQQGKLSAPVKLSTASASHVSVAYSEPHLYAVWREHAKSGWTLKVAMFASENNQLRLISTRPIEARAQKKPLLYPTIAASAGGLCVAWEDRRYGHTRLLYSHSDPEDLGFSAPVNLNEYLSNRNVYDKGNGVTRVSISAFAEEEVLAAWMDKRRGGVGYGIFAALGDEGGRAFGPNEKVHGEQGDRQPHYNPSTAGNRQGDFVVAWDDFRSGDSDVWLSVYNEDDEWSEDFSVAGASGPGEQSHASVALDEQGGLHLVWLQRADPLAPTGLWYSHGKPVITD